MEKRRFYYGWVIVGLSMVSMAFWFGIRATFSVFFVALIDHFHWGRAEAAGAQSIAMLVYMIMAPITGTLVDRIGPRKVVLPGIVLTGLGFLLCTQIQTLIQFYLFFGVIVGMGVTCLSIAPFTVILSQWFERKRGNSQWPCRSGNWHWSSYSGPVGPIFDLLSRMAICLSHLLPPHPCHPLSSQHTLFEISASRDGPPSGRQLIELSKRRGPSKGTT